MDKKKAAQEKANRKLGQDWEQLGIENDFIFGKVMQDVGLLKELVRLILRT